jgi:hypothetical protein
MINLNTVKEITTANGLDFIIGGYKGQIYKVPANEIISPPGSGGSGAVWGSVTGTLSDQMDLQIQLDSKQSELVSATNIKTINGTSVLGSGDLVIAGGGGTNPTSGLMPYNSGGSFVDTSIEIGSAFGSPTYKFKDSTIVSATYFTDTFLNMDYSVNEYSFGIASFSGGIPSAEIGMAMTGMRMVIGMNMQGGTDGVIRANGNTGVVSIGAYGVEYALGVNPFGGGVLIGSGFMETIPPANATVPAIWIWVTNENGLQYKIAGYQ